MYRSVQGSNHQSVSLSESHMNIDAMLISLRLSFSLLQDGQKNHHLVNTATLETAEITTNFPAEAASLQKVTPLL